MFPRESVQHRRVALGRGWSARCCAGRICNGSPGTHPIRSASGIVVALVSCPLDHLGGDDLIGRARCRGHEKSGLTAEGGAAADPGGEHAARALHDCSPAFAYSSRHARHVAEQRVQAFCHCRMRENGITQARVRQVPIIVVCTTAITSPASEPIIVKPTMRSSSPTSAFMNVDIANVVTPRRGSSESMPPRVRARSLHPSIGGRA